MEQLGFSRQAYVCLAHGLQYIKNLSLGTAVAGARGPGRVLVVVHPLSRLVTYHESVNFKSRWTATGARKPPAHRTSLLLIH